MTNSAKFRRLWARSAARHGRAQWCFGSGRVDECWTCWLEKASCEWSTLSSDQFPVEAFVQLITDHCDHSHSLELKTASNIRGDRFWTCMNFNFELLWVSTVLDSLVFRCLASMWVFQRAMLDTVDSVDGKKQRNDWNLSKYGLKIFNLDPSASLWHLRPA